MQLSTGKKVSDTFIYGLSGYIFIFDVIKVLHERGLTEGEIDEVLDFIEDIRNEEEKARYRSPLDDDLDLRDIGDGMTDYL